MTTKFPHCVDDDPECNFSINQEIGPTIIRFKYIFIAPFTLFFQLHH